MDFGGKTALGLNIDMGVAFATYGTAIKSVCEAAGLHDLAKMLDIPLKEPACGLALLSPPSA